MNIILINVCHSSWLQIWSGQLLETWCHIYVYSQIIYLRLWILQQNLIGKTNCILAFSIFLPPPAPLLFLILLMIFCNFVFPTLPRIMISDYFMSVLIFSFLSLALVAHQNNYVRPILTLEPLLDIQNGRWELTSLFSMHFIARITSKAIWLLFKL